MTTSLTAKSLLELVEGKAFRAARHARLLETDRSLFELVVAEDDPMFKTLMTLADIQLAYRSSSDGRERYDLARAFASGANRGDWSSYYAFFGDVPGTTFRPTTKRGVFILEPCPCERCEGGRDAGWPSRARLKVGRVASAPT